MKTQWMRHQYLFVFGIVLLTLGFAGCEGDLSESEDEGPEKQRFECEGNVCLRNNECRNADERCGTGCLNCNTANNAREGVCKDGICEITACANYYHMAMEGADIVCKLNSFESCGKRREFNIVDCRDEINAVNGLCGSSGECIATSCKDRYHIVVGKCEEDTVHACGLTTNDCTKLPGWAEGVCDDRQCIATQCQKGFCIDDRTGRCVNGRGDGNACGTEGGEQVCQRCDVENDWWCENGQCVRCPL